MPPKKLLSAGGLEHVLLDSLFANWFLLKTPINLADMDKNNSNCWSSVDKEFSARCELADYSTLGWWQAGLALVFEKPTLKA